MGDYIFFIIIAAVALLAVICAPSIKRWYQHTFMVYNEETGYWEKKTKKAAPHGSADGGSIHKQKVAPKHQNTDKKAPPKATRTATSNSANPPKATNNVNNSVQNTPSEDWNKLTPQEKSVRRTRDAYAKARELRAKNPGHNYKMECIGATVKAMARRAKVIERRGGKSYEVIRDFVVTFDSEYGNLYACVDENLFNDISIGSSGMMTLADGSYLTFEPFLDVTDLIK